MIGLRTLAGAVLVWSVMPAATAADFIESIVYEDEVEAIVVTFGCAVRYLEHDEVTRDKSLDIKLLGLRACRLLNDGGLPQLKDAGEALLGMQYRTDDQTIVLTLHFIENGRYLVSQGSDPRQIFISTRARAIDARTVEPELAQPSKTDRGFDEGEASERLAQARSDMLDGRYEAAINIYTDILERGPSSSHPEALEYLALAYQLSGRTQLAIERYTSWLDRFDDATGVERVQQRLDALTADNAVPTTVAQASTAAGKRWSVFGSVGQDIWSVTAESEYAGIADEDAEQTLALTYLDIGADYKGDAFALRGYTSVGYQHTLQTSREAERDDEPFARRAYLDYTSLLRRVSVRAGRQSTYGDGIMGMFDGLRGSYGITDRMQVNVTAGVPVDNPRYAADTEREFIATSLDVEKLLLGFDANFYTHLQKTAGIWDRQAVGSQWRGFGENWHVNAKVDVDLSYEVLNAALIEVGYRPRDWLKGHVRLNAYTSPFVGTSNALIGQQVASIDDLLQFYTDEQLRTLARNRTTDVRQVVAGLSTRLSERWTGEVESSYSRIDATIASADVAQEPEATQIETAARLIGGSIWRKTDTLILGYHLFSDFRADTHTAKIDWRFALAEKFRLNPRLSVSQRTSDVQGDQVIYSPSLRIAYLWRPNYQLSAEVSGRWSDRKLPASDPFMLGVDEVSEENQELFFYLQWRVDL